MPTAPQPSLIARLAERIRSVFRSTVQTISATTKKLVSRVSDTTQRFKTRYTTAKATLAAVVPLKQTILVAGCVGLVGTAAAHASPTFAATVAGACAAVTTAVVHAAMRARQFVRNLVGV